MIPLFKVFMSPEAGNAAIETMYSGMVTQGPKVEAFEHELKRFLDVRYLLTVNSGTSALQLACTLAGVKPGTKVISTPMTCSATNTAIRAVGGDIVWADIDPLTGNIDPESVEIALRTNTDIVAIMAVDWSGYPCNWSKLRDLAHIYNVKLIEDAAHGFGAEYKGEKLGAYADFTCYSFQAIKHLTTIDGGALVCLHEEDYKRGKLLRWFGIDREGPRKDFRCEEDIVEPGFKYHMNDVTASIGLAQLPHMPEIVGQHQRNGLYFDSTFKQLEGYGPTQESQVVVPPRAPDCKSAYWIYTIHVKDRAKFMEYMKENGVTTSQVHARNDTHTMFANYKRNLPGVDAFSRTQVSIPCGWWLSQQDRSKIANLVLNYAKGTI